MANKPRINKYGINSTFFGGKFRNMIRNMADYKPEELERDLLRMAAVARGDVEPDEMGQFNPKHGSL